MNRLLLLTSVAIIHIVAQNTLYCNNTCQCNTGSNVCIQCGLDGIGSQMDQFKRSCPCPDGFYNDVFIDCEYIYADSQISNGCVQNCRNYATLEEAKTACNLDSSCQGITWSSSVFNGVGATNPVGKGRGYQLRASNNSSSNSSTKVNSWLKGTCPNSQNSQPAYDGVCDYKSQQGAQLAGCYNDCIDYSNLADAQAACDADPSCGGVTFSRLELGGVNSQNAYDGIWGFQLRVGRTLLYSLNGENAWVKQICNACIYTNAYAQTSEGCVQGCKDFATLDEAKNACNTDQNCAAITYSTAANGGPNSTNPIAGYGHGYQLRASKIGTPSATFSENTWFKGNCSVDIQVNDPCDFQEYQGTYLAGCSEDCKDFSNVVDAQTACRADSTCAGITFTRAEIGGPSSTNPFDGYWGFQLRSQKIFIQSPNGEISWLKVDCPTVFHSCTPLIQVQEIETPCQRDIAAMVSSFMVDTTCFISSEVKNVFVNSVVNLDFTQAILPEGCSSSIQSYIQYMVPLTQTYVNLPRQYVTVGLNGQQTIKINLKDISKYSVTTHLNDTSTVQQINLLVFYGNGLSYQNSYKWSLYIYIDKDDNVQAFEVDVDVQQKQRCETGVCVIYPNQQITGSVYSDSTYSQLQEDNYQYQVGEHFYARISFLDPFSTEQLDFSTLHQMDDQHRIYDSSLNTLYNWDGSGLRIDLHLTHSSVSSAIIQVNMIIGNNTLRLLPSTQNSQNSLSDYFNLPFQQQFQISFQNITLLQNNTSNTPINTTNQTTTDPPTTTPNSTSTQAPNNQSQTYSNKSILQTNLILLFVGLLIQLTLLPFQ